MATNTAVPTKSQLPIPSGRTRRDQFKDRRNRNFTFQNWKEDGEALLCEFRNNERTLETNQWEIGDWLIKGVENKKFVQKEAYDAAEQITGYDRTYLQTVVWVVGRFRDPSLLKESTLKWSHFKELAYIEDATLREEVLNHFDDGLPHSVRQVREHVLEELAKHKGPGKKQKAEATQWVSMQVSLKPNLRRTIKLFAKIKRRDTDTLLREWVMDYYEEHEKEILVAIEKAKSKKKAKR